MSSIFLRYSSVPLTLSQPFDKPNARDEEGNLKVVNFPNQWGNLITSFATSGWLSLAAKSGIILNTSGYVDTSGLRANRIYAQNYGKIDYTGGFLPLYSGSTSGILYKFNDDNVATTETYIYNTSFEKITIPTATTGRLLYVGVGLDRNHTADIDEPTKEIDTYDFIDLVPKMTVDDTEVPSKISLNSSLVTVSGAIKIGPDYDGFKGKVLTHMGETQAAAWKDANFLPEGLEFHRYSKRPVLIENNRIIFYVTKPSWAADGDLVNFTQSILEQEFGMSDTIELMDDQGNRTYVKFSDSITYLTYDPPDNTPVPAYTDIVTSVTITDPIDNEEYEGLAVSICPSDPFESGYTGTGFAFSVKKGAYFSIVIASGAGTKERFACEGEASESPFTFKPSTMNTISTRPEVYTSFNQIAEDIDFIVYGKKTIQYDNYDPNLFDLNSNRIPAGLVPHFKVDAYIPNSVSGSPTGVYFTKYLDREKLQPSGWGYDEGAKVIINTTGAYVAASIPSGTATLTKYANLTVSGITYSDYIITREIYLKPVPLADGSSEYAANALLTVDKTGRIISKKPTRNPIRPSKPLNLRGILDHDSDGQGHAQASIEWDAPLNDGGSEVLSYIVQFSANDGNEWTTVPNGLTLDKPLGKMTSATVGNLSLSTPYIFRVAAQNAIGISDYSDNSEVFYSDITVPGKPVSFTGVRYFDETNLSEINLSWVAGHSGASTVSGYVLEESLDYGETWIYYNLPSNPITTTYETITGTDSSKDYMYRISSWNTDGQSAYSFVFVSGNLASTYTDDTQALSNWDFGKILFTGVCT